MYPLESYKPYVGLHKDFPRLIVLFFVMLLFTVFPISAFIHALNISLMYSICTGVFLLVFIIMDSLIIWGLVGEYKRLNIERENYEKFSSLLIHDRVYNENQKKHIIKMLIQAEEEFRNIEVIAIMNKSDLSVIEEGSELGRVAEPHIVFAMKLSNVREKVEKDIDLNEKECHVVNLAILDKLKFGIFVEHLL